MIRLSSGTAVTLGLARARLDAVPTTAYLLAGDSCLRSCAFCPLGSAPAVDGPAHLGRISWPRYPLPAVLEGLAIAEKEGSFQRVCLQSVRKKAGAFYLRNLIREVRREVDLPLSLSAWISNEREAKLLFQAGVERISIALDVVKPLTHRLYKGGSLRERTDLLLRCARNAPGRLVTHLICGLGESEREMITLAERLLRAGVTVALFAFAPLPHTPLAGASAPPLDSYRRIQAALYLLRTGQTSPGALRFAGDRLVSLGHSPATLPSMFATGEAFQTSGCPGCNRPYYNERPGKTLCNYPRTLTAKEVEEALFLLFPGR